MPRYSGRGRIAIDTALVDRLDTLAGAGLERCPETAYPLVRKLTSAQFVPEPQLPGNVVTIGSTVTYLDQMTGRTECVSLVWPEHGDISRGKVSVMTPIGVALLGLSSGQSARWTSAGGQVRSLTIELVTRDRAPVSTIRAGPG